MPRIRSEDARVEENRVGIRLRRRKPYAKPELIHELELETRAGTPLSIHDQLDPLGLEPPKE